MNMINNETARSLWFGKLTNHRNDRAVLIFNELKLSEQVIHVDFLVDDATELGDRNPSLLHGVALADRDAVVIQRIVVNGNAERSSDGILTTVTLSD